MEITGTPGEIYEQHIVPAVTARWTPELVELMNLPFGERALDVACGTGVVTRELPYRVGKTGRVVGLDINPGMLAYVITGYTAVDRSYTWHFSAAVPFILW